MQTKIQLWNLVNTNPVARKQIWDSEEGSEIIQSWKKAQGPYMQGQIVMYMGKEPCIDKMYDIRNMKGTHGYVQAFNQDPDGTNVEVVFVYAEAHASMYGDARKWAKQNSAPILFQAPHNMEDPIDFLDDLNKWQTRLNMSVNEFIEYLANKHNVYDVIMQEAGNANARFYIMSNVKKGNGYNYYYHCWFSETGWHVVED